jgi:hypothetical protein
MTRSKGRILSISEREALIDEKKDAEATLKDVQSGEYGVGTSGSQIDQNALKRRIDHLDKALHDGLPPKVRAKTKDELSKEAEMLRGRIQEKMPSKYEMDNPHLCPGAVRKHINWDKATQSDRERFREIMRTLEPDDPTAVDVEKLRREK